MKKLLTFITAMSLAVLTAASAHAQSGKVTKVVGTATVTVPGGAPTPLSAGSTVSQNATIKTGAGSEVTLEAFNGATACIKANSVVSLDKLGENEALLNITKGSLVSQLDPKKKATNNYSVKTPKGVAAARGTAYTISIDFSGGTNFSTLEGTVTLTPVGGGAPIVMPFGTASINGGAAQALSAAIASTPGLAADISTAVQTVAQNVQNGSTGAGSGATTVTVLAAVVSAAAQALPAQAATFTQQAVAAVTSSTSASGASSGASAAAAVNAITTAAVTAAPSQATAITASATTAAVQSAVTNSLAANPGDAAAAAAAGQAAAQSVQTAAVGAVNQAVATGTLAADNAPSVNDITAAVQSGGNAGTAAATANSNVTVAPPTVTPATATESSSTPMPVVTPSTPVDPSLSVSGAGGR